MTNLHHTPIVTGQAANAANINAPLGELDAAITTAVAQAQLAQEAVINAGTAATLTNGAASAGQKVVTVDSSSMIVAGATVEYALVGGVIETNTVASVNSGTQITLSTNIGTGGIGDNSMVAVVPVTYSNLKAGVYNVLDYGADRTGALDATAAIQAALNAATAGSVVLFPRGTYKILNGFIVEKPLTLRGDGSTLRFTSGGTVTNANAFWFRSAMDTNSASAKVYGPLGGVTYYRTFSGAVAEGARTFTLASTTGLTTNTRVMLLLGADPYDTTQPFLRMWNKVASVSGSDVTFALAVPEDINGTSHKCVTFDAIIENCGVENITIASDGVFAMEVALWFDKCRNVYARNLNLTTLPRGVVVEGSDNIVLENIKADAITQYSLLGGFGFSNLHASNLSVDDSKSTAVYFESQARGAVLENVRIGRGATATAGDASVIINGGCRGVILRGFHLTPAVAVIDAKFEEGAEVRTEDWYFWNSEYHREFPLRQHSGLLYHNEQLYSSIKRFSRRFPLYDGMPLDVGLPSGVYKDVRIWVSDAAHLTLFNMTSGGGDIKSLLTANTLVRPNTKNLTYIGKDTDYPYNNTHAKGTQIQCSGMPVGSYGYIEIEYYEAPGVDDDTTKGAAQALPFIIVTTTWNPGNLGDGQSANTTINSVTNARIGDVVSVGFSGIPNNGMWQLCAHVTAAEVITVALTNHTGSTVDLASGTLRCIVWQLAG